MSVPTSLNGLSTREAIADAVLRACQAIDTNDVELWGSAWAKDSNPTASLRGRTITGYDEITAHLFGHVGTMDTQHMVSNFRIDVQEGASTANLTAYAIAQHFRPAEGMKEDTPHRLAGALYTIETIKGSDGDWKIKSWDVKLLWVDGPSEVMAR